MNVCLVSIEYPPETGWGGVGTYTHVLAHGLAERGHTVHVVSGSFDRDSFRMDGKVHLHRVATQTWPVPGPLRRQGGGAGSLFLLERSATLAGYLRRLNRRVGFDVVEGSNMFAEALAYSLLPPTPLVVRVSTSAKAVATLYDRSLSPGVRLTHLMETALVRRADHVIAHTNFIAAEAVREYGLPPEKVTVVPQALDLDRIACGSAPSDGDARPGRALGQAAGEHRSPQTVLYVGRLERRKGAEYLLQAIPKVVAAVPEVRFRLAGSDKGRAPGGLSYRAYFERLATPEALRATEFLGFVDDAQLAQEYTGCQIFVAPSLYESFHFTPLEAMARGKPVVAFRATASPETIVDGQTGLLVPPEDADALAEAMIRLLRSPAEARAMGQRGRARAEREFSLRRNVEGTLDVYDAVVRRARARARRVA